MKSSRNKHNWVLPTQINDWSNNKLIKRIGNLSVNFNLKALQKNEGWAYDEVGRGQFYIFIYEQTPQENAPPLFIVFWPPP